MSSAKGTTVAALTILIGLLPSVTRAERNLGFEQRLDAQRAIDRVYFQHLISSGASFDEAVPREFSERRVRTYLAQSAALARIWKQPVTAEQLRAEQSRILRESRSPERIREVLHALGDDTFVFEECFVRPVLVSRLARNFFASDRVLQAGARRDADELYGRLSTRRLNAGSEHPLRTIRELEGSAVTGDAVGRPGPVVEDRDAFTIDVPLTGDDGIEQVATYSVPKRSWDEWFQSVSGSLARTEVRAVASDGDAPPMIASATSCVPDDTWANGSLDDVPDGRSGHSAIWTGTEMIVWGGEHGANGVDFDGGGRYNPLTDTWTPISRVNAPLSRVRHVAVWTGDRMLIWGGAHREPSGGVETLISGGLYDPATDTWTAMSTANAPEPRQYFSTVWSGTELIVWGGVTGSYGKLNTGARYDPVQDVWTPTATAGAPSARQYHTAVWAGNVMVVWGGLDGSSFTSTGGRYDPATDSWTSTTLGQSPAPRSDHTAIWTGSRMVVWGGRETSCCFNSGGLYDPVANTWSPTSLVSAPAGRISHQAAWVGGKMVIWGGGSGSSALNDGKRYDPVTDAWTSLSAVNAPAWRSEASIVGAGTGLILWGGHTPPPSNQNFRSGARYDVAGDTWAPTSLGDGPPLPNAGPIAVWTGNEMIVWGQRPVYSNTGARYDPSTDAWTPVTTAGAPSIRAGATGVWAGGRLVVWGGWDTASQKLNTGGRYDPIADEWQPISTAGAPNGRSGHDAVSTGDRMIVWGGTSQYQTQTSGGVYDVAGDTWTPTATTGAPSVRSARSAVWAGDRMIVWGGYGTQDLNDGAAYDPILNAWSSVSLAGAPSARRSHLALWTGTEMIVWGGASGSINYPADGGRYNPATDSWAYISADGAPGGRTASTALWTGHEMVLFDGQRPDGGQFDDGFRYDPGTGSWTPISLSGAPSARSFHSAVWTGNSMIVWGGMTSMGYLSSGGQYVTGAIAPGEIQGVGWQPGGMLRWSALAGTGTVYDVIRGSLGMWPVGTGSEVYLGEDLTSPSIVDPEAPGPGGGFFYLVRARNACTDGGFGSDSAGHVRVLPVVP